MWDSRLHSRLGLVRKGLILESAINATTEKDKNISNNVETR